MYKYTVASRLMLKRPISYVVILLVTFIVAMYLVVISVLEGFKNHYMDKIQSVLAHATVNVGEYAWGIQRPREWSDELKKIDPGIKGITLGIETPTMVIFDTARTISTLRGIDLADELKIGRMGETLKPPNPENFGVREVGTRKVVGCIVGGSLRRQFNLKIGGQISMVFTDEEDNPRTISCTIAGFSESSGSYMERDIYVEREYLAGKLGGKVPHRAKTMYFWLNEPNRPDLPQLKLRIKEKMKAILLRDDPQPQLLERINVETWQEKDNNFYEAVTRENLMMRFIMGIFLLLTAFIIFLIFGRLVAEKVRDIGALRALGASPSGIMQTFLIQGLFIGILGLLFGLAFSELLLRNMNELCERLGFNPYPAVALVADKIPYITLASDRILISVLTIGSALLGALVPSWLASRLNPVECLRHE